VIDEVGRNPAFAYWQEKPRPVMTDDEDSESIDPVDDNLDPETLRAVQKLIRGFPSSSPTESSPDLTDYREGRRDAFGAVLSVITHWLDELESDSGRDCSNDEDSEEGR
jgi:hypothetical protein